MSRLALLLAPLLVLACAGDDGTDELAADSDEPGLIGADVPWPDKTHEEKFSWMTYRVLPEVRAKFEAFDASYVDNFTCANCHGTETASSGYGVMPSATGPAELSISDWPTQSSDATLRAYAAFMEDELEPLMADLLDTTVGMGADQLSCSTCHRIN